MTLREALQRLGLTSKLVVLIDVPAKEWWTYNGSDFFAGKTE
jgi:hypothetical protein